MSEELQMRSLNYIQKRRVYTESIQIFIRNIMLLAGEKKKNESLITIYLCFGKHFPQVDDYGFFSKHSKIISVVYFCYYFLLIFFFLQ